MTASEEKQESSSNGSVRHLRWVSKPENAVVHDDAFWVKRQRWGTFVSVDASDLQIVTALTEELCISSTRWYLKAKQEGFPEGSQSYNGSVEGKL